MDAAEYAVEGKSWDERLRQDFLFFSFYNVLYDEKRLQEAACALRILVHGAWDPSKYSGGMECLGI